MSRPIDVPKAMGLAGGGEEVVGQLERLGHAGTVADVEAAVAEPFEHRSGGVAGLGRPCVDDGEGAGPGAGDASGHGRVQVGDAVGGQPLGDRPGDVGADRGGVHDVGRR
jgi:hypothetical protein